MRQAQQRVTHQQVAQTSSRPAPVGGWNARDSVADMPDGDAVQLTNFLPRSTSVDLRLGHTAYKTGFTTNPVNSLFAYNPPTTKALFAAAGTNIYDVSAGGAIGAAVVAGTTSDKWQFTNIATSGGNFLYIVNGSDNAIIYDGITWQIVTAISAPIAITNINTNLLITITLFKFRLFFIQKDSLIFWYLPVNSVGGAAASFDLRPLFRRGGKLMDMGVWTLDGGYGMDDYLALVTDQGEVAVYKGTDPSAAATWALVGVYYAGASMSRRCFVKFGGDLILLCRDGAVSMSSLLSSTRVNPTTNLTYKIQSAISDATYLYNANYGWEGILAPNENFLLLNIPKGIGIQEQYIMNTITGSWSNITGWWAACWVYYDNVLYFGTNIATGNYIGRAMLGFTDNGSNIVGTVVENFSYFGPHSKLKSFRMVRPVFFTSGTVGISLGICTDFDVNSVILGTPTYTPSTAALWDSAKWDQAVWSGGLSINNGWQTISGYGYAGAIKMIITTNNSVCAWVSNDYEYEVGGVL